MGYDYCATPIKDNADAYGGVIYEIDADPDDDESLRQMTEEMSAVTGENAGVLFVWGMLVR